MDTSSNEDGGRAIFERDKGYREIEIAKYRAERPIEIERRDRIARGAKDTYDALRAAFVEKYGSEQVANLELALKTRNDGDLLSISPEARALLRDAEELSRQRKYAEGAAIMAIMTPRYYATRLQLSEYVNAVTNSMYEMRFNKDPQIRLQALQNLDELQNGKREEPETLSRSELLARAKAAVDPTSIQPTAIEPAAVTAPARNIPPQSGTGTTTPVETPKVLSPSTLEIPDERKLFKIDPSDNSVKLDIKALANLTPDQMALEQLKKLAESLRKRYGTADLRETLTQALADRTVELAVQLEA